MVEIRTLGRVGMVGRFKPLHNGAAVVLEELCKQAEEVVIGIGSANKYNARNPFTAEETAGMLNAFLKPKYTNYTIVEVDDFAHIPGNEDGQKWKETVKEKFGDLDFFVSGNDFVRNLLKDTYKVIYTFDFLKKEQYVKLKAAKVRFALATYGNWETLVPKEVYEHMNQRGLTDRFRREFGLATIAMNADYDRTEDLHEEIMHAREK